VEIPTLGPKDRSQLEGSGEAASGTVRSPMPGTLEKVSVKEGDKVTKGQQLGTLVAMKMEVISKSYYLKLLCKNNYFTARHSLPL
jgi:biotin carboxyl carrier protein